MAQLTRSTPLESTAIAPSGVAQRKAPENAASAKQIARRRILVLAALLAAVQLPGGALGAVGTYASFLLALIVIFKREWRDLPSLLLLNLPSAGYGTTLELSRAAGIARYFPEPSKFVFVAGVQTDVPLVCVLGATVHVVYRLLASRGRSLDGIQTPFAFWCLALIPSIASSVYGWSQGITGWSVGARGIMCFVGLFWGVELVETDESEVTRQRRLLGCIAVGCLIYASNLMADHMFFLFAGLAAASIPLLLQSGRIVTAILAIGCSGVLAMRGTFTTLGIVALALALSAISSYAVTALFRKFALAGAIAVSAIVITGTVALAFGEMQAEMPSESTQLTPEKTVGDLSYKIVSDRGLIWRSAFEMITSEPYIIVPSGRPIPIRGSRDYAYWTSGAHNAVLQSLAQSGIIAGTIATMLILTATSWMLRILASDKFGVVPAWAAGIAGVAIMGSATGNFPVVDQVGFSIWTIAGYLWGLPRTAASALPDQTAEVH